MRRRQYVVLALLTLTVLLVAISLVSAAGARPAPRGPDHSTQLAALVTVSHVTAMALSAQRASVYITNTGTKYHRKGCRYLDKSKHRVSLSWAKSHGYKPCKVCKPPR